MESIRKQARLAGLLYVLVAVTAPIGLVYVPGKLIVRGDATATADRLRASAALLRLGIASELFHQVLEVFLILVLFDLFKPVSRTLARQLFFLGLIPIPIVFLNVLSEIAALILTSGASFLAPFDRGQLDALAFLCLRLHGQGIQIAAIYWGLWLFPFGLLVLRCGFIPRLLGVFLMLAGSGYLLGSIGTLILPQYESALDALSGILELGEIPIILWLAIWGARPPSPRTDTPAPAR